jgi:hypothetical protein
MRQTGSRDPGRARLSREADGNTPREIRASSTEFQQNRFFRQPGIIGLGPDFQLQFNSIRILLN